MIGVRFEGRFGNNCFQYAVALSVARRNDYTLGVPPWAGPDIFSGLTAIEQNGWAPSRVWTEENGAQEFDPGVFEVADDTLLTGFLQTDRYFTAVEDEVRREFRVRKDVLSAAEQAAGDRDYICVHSREGDYPLPWRVDTHYYRSALAAARERVGDLPVKLISDNSRTPALRNVTSHQLVGGDWRTDFAIMSNARACVIAASTFSWWAAWLNTSAEVVTMPRYFLNYRKGKAEWFPGHIVPDCPRWVVVG